MLMVQVEGRLLVTDYRFRVRFWCYYAIIATLLLIPFHQSIVCYFAIRCYNMVLVLFCYYCYFAIESSKIA